MNRNIKALFCAGALAAALPAFAQQPGLVNVDISDVRADIAKGLSVESAQIPASVQVPVGIAAQVCNVGADTLAPAGQGQPANCKATSTNTALNQLVQRGLEAKK
jgi:hypothetical protein